METNTNVQKNTAQTAEPAKTMAFTLYTADCTGNAANCLYPNRQEIRSKEELLAATVRDHTFAAFDGNRRGIEHFIVSDVIPMDCDNDHSENPEEWYTVEALHRLYGDISHVILPNRHHLLPKGEHAARPRMHILFPCHPFTDADTYAKAKAAIQRRYPFLDANALDAARFFFGNTVAPEDAVWHEGICLIDEALPSEPEEEESDAFAALPGEVGTIPEGTRNKTLYRYACRILIRLGNTEKARTLFLDRASRCNPPLAKSELKSIWQSAGRFSEKVHSSEDYISPDDFAREYRSLKPDDYTDLGQAKILAREYHNELIYTKATDFPRYDGTVWLEEPQLALGAAEEFTDLQLQDAKDTVAQAEKALIDLGVDPEKVRNRDPNLMFSLDADHKYLFDVLKAADNYVKLAIKYLHYKNLDAVLKMTKPLVARDVSELDKDPMLLNTPGGSWHLAKGEMQPHRAEDYLTRITLVAPGSEGAELWHDAVKLFFCGDEELIDYVQQQVGMAAIGKVYQEHLIIAYGGANGKSTFWNAILRGMGKYAGKLSPEVLTVNCKFNVKPELAELKGKRLIISSEMEEGMRLNTSTVKQLCSTDEIEAAKKFKDLFHYVPTHTLVLYTNHLPRVGANDDGIWRRLIVIPFNARITGSSDIKNYADYLVDHAGPAILQWIAEGAKKAIAHDFQTPLPRAVEEAIGHYRDANDWLGQFLDEFCEIAPEAKEKSGELYQTYLNACAQRREYTRNSADFYEALEKAGFTRKRSKTARWICGLRLKDGQDFLC